MKAIPLESGSDLSILPASVAHADMFAALVGRDVAHLARFLPALGELASPDAARVHLAGIVAQAARGDMLEWHLFVDDALCGSVRVKEIDRHDRKGQIGYFVGSEFAGRGIVTRAVRAVLAYCFDTLELNRVELRCAATNAPSIRMAQRLGFTHEGVLREDEWLQGRFVDSLVYGMLRAEFTR